MKVVVERPSQTHGRLDVLMNNAGLGIGGSRDHETKKLDMQLNVNLRGVYLLPARRSRC